MFDRILVGLKFAGILVFCMAVLFGGFAIATAIATALFGHTLLGLGTATLLAAIFLGFGFGFLLGG